MEYRVDVGGRFAGICARVNDNRSKRIDIIRKTFDTPAPPLTTEQLARVKMAKDKQGNKYKKLKLKVQKPENQSLNFKPNARSV